MGPLYKTQALLISRSMDLRSQRWVSTSGGQIGAKLPEPGGAAENGIAQGEGFPPGLWCRRGSRCPSGRGQRLRSHLPLLFTRSLSGLQMSHCWDDFLPSPESWALVQREWGLPWIRWVPPGQASPFLWPPGLCTCCSLCQRAPLPREASPGRRLPWAPPGVPLQVAGDWLVSGAASPRGRPLILGSDLPPGRRRSAPCSKSLPLK